MIALGIVFLIVAGLGVAAFAFGAGKSAIGDRLAAIDASAGLGPRTEKSIFQRLMDEQQRNAMSRRLSEAGWYTVTPQQMLLRRVGGLVGGAVLGMVIFLMTHGGPLGLVALVLFGFCGSYYPLMQLNRAVEERKRQVLRTLPDFLDMLSTTVEAGVGLNGAIATAVEDLSGALGDEMRAALQDIRLGRSRADALIAMANRVREPDLTTMVTAVIQSERAGAGISNVLEQLAQDARERRLMRAEEIAGQLPNKLVFPMALFMLPALFMIIIGGVLAKFLNQ